MRPVNRPAHSRPRRPYAMISVPWLPRTAPIKVIRLGTNKIQCSRSTIVKVASGRAIHSVGSHTAEAESAGLAGGASRIRTRGPTLSTRPTGYADDGGHGRRSPRPGTSERQEHLDASALRPKGRLQQPHRKFLVAAAANGTEGSNPACSSGESVSPVHSEAAREKSRAFAGLCA